MFFLDNIWLIPLLPAVGAAHHVLFRPQAAEADRQRGLRGSGGAGVCLRRACAVWQYTGYAHDNPGKPFEKIVYTWLGTDTGHMNLRQARRHSGSIPGRCRLPARSAFRHLAAVRHRRGHADPYLFHRIHGARRRLLPLLRIPQPVHVLHADPHPGEQLCLDVRGMGRRGPVFVSADRFLLPSPLGQHRRQQGIHRQPHWRRRLPAGNVHHRLVLRFAALHRRSPRMARSGHFAIGDPIITAATLLLFVGACGKSAQLPLYVWLPDAMEGPTPVSALIHAATMVTAGVYMVARSNALFVLAPGSMKTMAIIGAFTALFAASIALVQNDIKRVLAYSTVSQLGYMFLALGVGAFAAGVFHVFTHAFFKALLFLGAGSVIHAMSGEQDMRNMGDLAPPHPDHSLDHVYRHACHCRHSRPSPDFSRKTKSCGRPGPPKAGPTDFLWLVGYVTALMTAFYMFRLMFLTFHGQPRMSHEVEHHIHESPKSMTVPLIVLAICAVCAGWLGWPHSLGGSNRFEKFLEPVFAREAPVLQAEGELPSWLPDEKRKSTLVRWNIS